MSKAVYRTLLESIVCSIQYFSRPKKSDTYVKDKNEDDSFDAQWDMTPCTIGILRLMSMIILNTPHYLWMVTMICAYIIPEAPEAYFAFYSFDYYVSKPLSEIYYRGPDPDSDIYTEWKAASTMACYDECNG